MGVTSFKVPGMLVHICHLSIGEAEAGGSQVEGQAGLQIKKLYQKKVEIWSQGFSL